MTEITFFSSAFVSTFFEGLVKFRRSRKRLKSIGLRSLLASSTISVAYAAPKKNTDNGQWGMDKAWQWYNNTPWMVGAQYTTSNAVNQLEMFQSDTYSPELIDRELGWLANDLKMNTIRVFLHYLPWYFDPNTTITDPASAFLDRLDNFLSIAYGKHGIKTIFVLFDDCWDPNPKPGKQPEPRPHVILSKWVQCPGAAVKANTSAQDELLEPYVTGVMKRFGNDPRVIMWDLYNEVANPNAGSYDEPEANGDQSLALLKKVYVWARKVGVSQPLTNCVWNSGLETPVNQFAMANSDIITFHNYGPLLDYMFNRYLPLRAATNRPIVCTEYMARTLGSTFEAILPYAKAERIGSITWSAVNGKTQCNYPWDSWQKNYTEPPNPWFHDVFTSDHKPFDQREVDLVSSLVTV